MRRGSYATHPAERCPTCDGAWFTAEVVRALRANHLPGEPLPPQAPLRADALPCPGCRVDTLFSYRSRGICVSACERCQGAFLDGSDLRALERELVHGRGQAESSSVFMTLSADALGELLAEVLASYMQP
jgi:Zn-finger nucleic acid-binding protein